MLHEVIDTSHIAGLRNFQNYQKLNPVETLIESKKIIESLLKYKKYKYRLVIESLLFSSRIQDDTEICFISCSMPNDAKEALINSGFIYLSEIIKQDIIKGNSKTTNAIFDDSEHFTTLSHFAFAFTTKNVLDLFNFIFKLVDGEGNLTNFTSTKKKNPILSFRI